jgi:hypothetical protein
MPTRAIVYLPVAGTEAVQLGRACAGHCERHGYELAYVSIYRGGVWSVMERQLADVVVVARAADRDQLLPVDVAE